MGRIDVIMIKEISVQKVKGDAEEFFRKGEYYCSEAIVAAIKKNFEVDMPDEMIAMASGFPVGIGKTKCTCGAISGAILSVGYFFGRTKGSTPQDPRSVKTLELAKELQEYFRGKNKVSCCSILTKGMDMSSGEHKAQCVRFTGEMAEKTAQVIARELNIKNIDVE